MNNDEVMKLAKKTRHNKNINKVIGDGFVELQKQNRELQNRVRELEEVLKMATGGECTCISGTRVCYSCRVQKIIDDALANTNTNSAEIARLKVEIEVLCEGKRRGGNYLSCNHFTTLLTERRARLAELENKP